MIMKREELLRGMDIQRVLFGTFFSFSNCLQTVGDSFFDEITCKQFFFLICLRLFKEEAPTIKELAEVMGSTHQNVKQIVDKLEKSGFVTSYQDEYDKRKLRVVPTEKMAQFENKYVTKNNEFLNKFYEGVTEEDIKNTLRVLSKLESNLLSLKGGLK